MTKDYKYIHNRECLLKDWGKSMRFGKYFVEWYDEDDDNDCEVSINTKDPSFKFDDLRDATQMIETQLY